jgi:hypothetical protein
LHEGVGWFPVAFPPECIPAFLAFCLDARIYWFHRATCAEGVVWAAGKSPGYRELVAAALANEIERGILAPDDTTPTWIAIAAARSGDPRVSKAIERAFDAGVIDDFIAGERDYLLHVPHDWFLDAPAVHHTLESYLAGVRGRAKAGGEGK